MGPHTKMDAGFKVLKEKVIVPGPREYRSNDWISKGTWALVDRRAGLRREGKLSQSTARSIGREIKTSLKADRVARVRSLVYNGRSVSLVCRTACVRYVR